MPRETKQQMSLNNHQLAAYVYLTHELSIVDLSTWYPSFQESKVNLEFYRKLTEFHQLKDRIHFILLSNS
jgi:hypothetical protein